MPAAIEPPLLETRGLSMRFGGLTALDGLDLSVERGKIVSIIGPNGAGKTTLFNCISGVLRPTSGAIAFAGRGVRRAGNGRLALRCLAVGLLTSLAVAGLATNPNGLWRAVIRRPANLSDRPFSWRAMIPNAVGYFRGELAIERQAGRWNVVTADGGVLLASRASRQSAEKVRAAYERVSRSLSELSVSTSPAKRRQLIEVGQRRIQRQRLAWGALVGGFVIGSLGMLAVWRRSRWTPELVAAAGVARTFQNLRLFKRMTALENVLVGLEARRRQWPRHDRLQEAHRLLAWVGLASHAQRPAGALAYGDQRRLEMARALAMRPGLLLLDEPAAGMNSSETASLMGCIRELRDRGVTTVLIEHDMQLVMGISDQVVVLDYGRKIAEGPPEEVRGHPAVIEAYLGAG
jgi:branched-chain amino acid transport system ATP-binding protein